MLMETQKSRLDIVHVYLYTGLARSKSDRQLYTENILYEKEC